MAILAQARSYTPAVVETRPPAPDNLVSMADVDSQFMSMAEGLNVPKVFIDFLKSERFADRESMSFLAPSEESINAEIFEVLKADGKEITELTDRIAIKKLWKACRVQSNRSGSAAVDAKQEPEGLPHEVELDIKRLWSESHGFVLQDAWLLQTFSQKSLWKEVNNSAPKVEIMLMEQLRLASSIIRNPGTMLDTIHGSIEVFTRARAWFLPLQAAIFGSEKIMARCLKSNNGQQPPTSHLAEAWAATVGYFGEQVRVSGKDLEQFVMNTGAWEHKWSFSVNGSGGSRVNTVGLPPDLQDELRRVRAEARATQAANDRLRLELRNATNGGGNNDANINWHKGGKGKGKGDKGGKGHG